MMKKAYGWKMIPVALLISVFLTACFATNAPRHVTKVKMFPENFTLLTQLDEEYGDILDYTTFEGAVIYFSDLDGIRIEQRLLDDAEFLVSYEDEWYVESSVAEEIVSKAQETFELREKLFEVGEPIDLYRADDDVFSFALESISYQERLPQKELSNGNQLCLLEFSASGNDVVVKSAVEYFKAVTTSGGLIVEDFIEISETEVAILLPKEETVKVVYVQSPTYRENVRKVKVS